MVGIRKARHSKAAQSIRQSAENSSSAEHHHGLTTAAVCVRSVGTQTGFAIKLLNARPRIWVGRSIHRSIDPDRERASSGRTPMKAKAPNRREFLYSTGFVAAGLATSGSV